jgi:hypothetical protein
MIRTTIATILLTVLFSGVSGLTQTPRTSLPAPEGAQAPSAEVTDRIVTALSGALKDPDREVRRNAVRALAGFDSPRIVEPMIAVLKDEDVELRKHAANALARHGDERAVPALIASLKDPDPSVRAYAARALGAVGDARAVDPLTAALKDEHAAVRRTAIRALGAIADGKGPRGSRKVGMFEAKPFSFEMAEFDNIFELDQLFEFDEKMFELDTLFEFDKVFESDWELKTGKAFELENKVNDKVQQKVFDRD